MEAISLVYSVQRFSALCKLDVNVEFDPLGV